MECVIFAFKEEAPPAARVRERTAGGAFTFWRAGAWDILQVFGTLLVYICIALCYGFPAFLFRKERKNLSAEMQEKEEFSTSLAK